MRQKRPRGLGHAVGCGAPFTGDEPFFVMLGDVIIPDSGCLTHLTEVHERYGGASVIAVEEVEREMVSRYGVIAGTEVEPGVYKLTDLVEKPPVNEAPSNLAIFGRYLLTPKIMQILPKTEPGRGDEIQLTDAIRELLKTEEVYAVRMTSTGYDTGNVQSWLEANVELALKTEEWGEGLRANLRRLIG